mgnify:CR=1 FL=1
MQRVSGSGMVFVEIDGELIEYELEAGQQILVDTGNVAGFTPSVQIDIKQVAGIKNKLLGGEGFFNTLLTGPGRVWLTYPTTSKTLSFKIFLLKKAFFAYQISAEISIKYDFLCF